jgi:hypothetical protein
VEPVARTFHFSTEEFRVRKREQHFAASCDVSLLARQSELNRRAVHVYCSVFPTAITAPLFTPIA